MKRSTYENIGGIAILVVLLWFAAMLIVWFLRGMYAP
jgi:hypothetical protein